MKKIIRSLNLSNFEFDFLSLVQIFGIDNFRAALSRGDQSAVNNIECPIPFCAETRCRIQRARGECANNVFAYVSVPLILGA